jgi:hypothetical protein
LIIRGIAHNFLLDKFLFISEGIVFIHESKENPWGQRVMRFYDLDKYIVEVSESMESVAKRFLAKGLSVEETAERTMFPVEFVKGLLI